MEGSKFNLDAICCHTYVELLIESAFQSCLECFLFQFGSSRSSRLASSWKMGYNLQNNHPFSPLKINRKNAAVSLNYRPFKAMLVQIDTQSSSLFASSIDALL